MIATCDDSDNGDGQITSISARMRYYHQQRDAMVQPQ